MASALDTLGRAARSMLEGAPASPGLYILAAAASAVVLGLVAAALARSRRKRREDAVETAAGASEASLAEPRILLLKLRGDLDNAVGVRLSGALARGCEGVATVAHVGGSPIKPGDSLDDEVRRVRPVARKARVALTIWGDVEGEVLRLRILKCAAAATPEMHSLPAHLRPPFNVAAAAYAAAAGAETAALAGLRAPLADLLDELAAALEEAPPEDAGEAIRLRAATARAALALDTLEPGRGRLRDALLAVDAADGRRAAEPLEWAEFQALRGEALARSHARSTDASLTELRDRVEACRGALEVWTDAGLVGRLGKAEAALGQALLDLAERDGDVRGLEDVERLAEAALARRGTSDADPLVMTALLGAARLRLGEREPRTARLEAAERELRRALVMAEAANDAARAAAIKIDLARALARLGERDRGSERLRAAAVIYRVCLAENGRDELTRARARAALGRTLVHVGERDRDAAVVDEAVAALRMASNSFAECGAAAAATQTRLALARAERLYAQLRAARAGAPA